MASAPLTTAGRISRPHRRKVWYCAGLVLLLVMMIVIQRTRLKVLIGQKWPSEQWVSADRTSHSLWNELLSRHVDVAGNVNYAAWLASNEDLRQLDEYLAELSHLSPIMSSSKESELAFWINAYNAVTIKGILREYPTSSIQNHVSHVGGYSVWRDLRLRIADRNYSLGQIEHGVLRKLNEPRIHFAIVCASHGCPRLLNEAYTADRLEEQLSRNTAAFFADSSKCQFDSTTHELRLSPILNWYADDFGPTLVGRLQAISPWLPDANLQSLARSGNLTVTYLDYDWNLNDQATSSTEAPIPPP